MAFFGKNTAGAKHVSLGVLTIGALGVIYGDIGTSPLYAINQIFFGYGRVAVTTDNILGAISLVFWALTVVVTLKYMLFVLLASHEGQGGVFALLSFFTENKRRIGTFLIALLVLAAGLVFGEGVITPAISIMSAVEGLAIIAPVFSMYIVPITLLVLTALFIFQYKGTQKIGFVFGPIMVIWFFAIASLGLSQIIQNPAILNALNPLYAVTIISSMSIIPFLLLIGAIVLVIAGVEALYADLGHFGLKPIRICWVFFVYPALVLNYLGQGAYLLSGNPVFEGNIFYSLVPQPLLLPMVALATVAAVIASQALISGAYSIVAQAIALNYLPRFKVVHTNKKQEGQIYVPVVNWLLYIGAVFLVLQFGSSTALAPAYGFAISGVMLTTSLAMLAITAKYWGWNIARSISLFGIFALIDLLFFVSKSLKLFEGGYVPMLIGFCIFLIMMTWHWGRAFISKTLESYGDSRKMSLLMSLKEKLEQGIGVVVDGRGQFVEAGRAVIFLVSKPVLALDDQMPLVVRMYMRHTGSIPKHTILLTISQKSHPYVRKDKFAVKNFGFNVFSVEARFGFMEEINFQKIVDGISDEIPILKTGKYVVEAGNEELRIEPSVPFLKKTRAYFFRRLQRLAVPAYRYFGLESSTILSTVTIPVYVNTAGGKVVLPELDLAPEAMQ